MRIPRALVWSFLVACGDTYPEPCTHPDPRPECTGEVECPVDGEQDGFTECAPVAGTDPADCPRCASSDGTCPDGCVTSHVT